MKEEGTMAVELHSDHAAEGVDVPRCQPERVTPEKAAAMLSTSAGNRRIVPSRVEEWAAEMRAGSWRLGPTIEVDTDGHLINGHHRLQAVVKVGFPVEFMVMRGVSPDAVDVVDNGRARSFGDVLAMRGVPDASYKATVTLMLRLYDKMTRISDAPSTTKSRTNRQAQLAAWERYQEEVEAAVPVGRELARQIGLTRPVGAVMYALLARQDVAYATDFCTILASGVGGERDAPILLLRRVLVRDALARRARGRQSLLTGNRIVAFAFKAWNAWLDGSDIKVLSWREVGPMAEPFPVPKIP